MTIATIARKAAEDCYNVAGTGPTVMTVVEERQAIMARIIERAIRKAIIADAKEVAALLGEPRP